MKHAKRQVLVLGGGVAGLSAALALARRRVAATLAEASPRLGGQAAGLCCKAVEACARCGACRLGDLLAEAGENRHLELLTAAKLQKARALAHGWRVELAPSKAGGAAQPSARRLRSPLGLTASAVILAVGHAPFNPARKSQFGFGRLAGVTSARKLEKTLAAGRLDPRVRSIAFIQCVGSRDQSIGHLWCSRVCCGYALRMARMLKAADPARELVFYHMDVQRYGRAWEDELAALRGELEFVRALPSSVRQGAQGPEVVYALPDGRPQARPHDLVVLSVGLTPPAGAAALAAMFGLERDTDGFLAEAGPRVFVAGAAAGPRSIGESIEHGELAAARAWAALAPGREAAHG